MTREEAIEIIRKNMPSDKSLPVYEAIQTLIPELSESEDEKIRKELIEFIQWSEDRGMTRHDFHQAKRPSEWIAYLEKQKDSGIKWLKSDNVKNPDKPYIDKAGMFYTTDGRMCHASEIEKQKEQDNEEGDFTIYHPLKNGKGEYECIPYSFYGSLTSFSEDKDLIDFLRTCFYTEEECNEWIEQQKEPHYTKRNALFDKCVENCDPEVMKSVSDEVDEMLEKEKQKEQKPKNELENAFKYYTDRGISICCEDIKAEPKKEQKPELPSKLDVAAIDFADYARKQLFTKDYAISSIADYDHGCIDGFKAGAKWQKEQKPWKVGANAYFIPEQKPEEKPINWTELTWKDINELEGIINNVHYEFRNGIGQESFGKEVLERFRSTKGIEYLDEAEQKYWRENEPKSEVGDDETEVQKAYREGKNAGRKEVFDHPEYYGLQPRRMYDYETGERNPEWSEEDWKLLDEVREHIIGVMGDKADLTPNKIYDGFLDLIDRLKFAKPQLKQEWSKEDKDVIDEAAELALGWGCPNLSAKLKSILSRVKPAECSEREKRLMKALQITNAQIAELVEENYKLKEQKPVDYEAELKKCKDNPLYFYDKYVTVKLKSAKWSEEDEQWLESIIKDYEDNLTKDKDHAAVIKIKIDFLKSLRLKSHSEWRHYIWTTNLRFDFTALIKYDNTDNYEIVQAGNRPKQEKNGVYILIKDIKPQPSWKPSEDQMEALNALNLHGDLSYVGQQNQLISLYQDLKKLK